MPTLVVDTREKEPYEFPGIDSVVRKPLNVGDYTHEGYEDVYAVERKTLDDLARSLGRDRTRFKNEILRANGLAERNDAGNPLPGTKPDHGGLAEFVVVIEADRGTVEEYSDRLSRTSSSVGDLKRKALRGQTYVPYLSAMHPNAILSTIEQWPDRYDSLKFVWADDRESGKQETLRLLDRWFLTHGGST
jgi:hypothetical protein